MIAFVVVLIVTGLITIPTAWAMFPRAGDVSGITAVTFRFSGGADHHRHHHRGRIGGAVRAGLPRLWSVLLLRLAFVFGVGQAGFCASCDPCLCPSAPSLWILFLWGDFCLFL